MAKRPKRPTRSAAAGSDADAKKAKPHVHVSSHKIMIPPNTEPESPKLDAKNESKRAARNAEAATTGRDTAVEAYLRCGAPSATRSRPTGTRS